MPFEALRNGHSLGANDVAIDMKFLSPTAAVTLSRPEEDAIRAAIHCHAINPTAGCFPPRQPLDEAERQETQRIEPNSLLPDGYGHRLRRTSRVGHGIGELPPVL